MRKSIADYVAMMDLVAPRVGEASLRKFLQQFRAIQFPSGYLEFLRLANGADGSLGDGSMIIYDVKRAAKETGYFQHDDFINKIFVFGGNGAGEAFAFDLRAKPPTIVVIPWICISWDDAIPQGRTFEGFLARAETGRLFSRAHDKH